jgi:hypothetical protein
MSNNSKGGKGGKGKGGGKDGIRLLGKAKEAAKMTNTDDGDGD